MSVGSRPGLGTDGLVSYAGPGDWQQRMHVEPVWGTHVVLDVRAPELPPDVDDLLAEAVSFLHQVDAWFSTYRADTPITMYRNGLIELERTPSIVQSVLEACAGAKQLTDGVFDPWAVPGGVDPSGYVKGWAAGVAADMLHDAGIPNVCVDASGDIAVHGRMSADEEWAVGITNPYDTQSVIRVVHLPDGTAMATSGLYERGEHIRDTSGGTSVHYDSATVVGPDAGLADALATACLVEGPRCNRWFVGLDEWSVYLVKDGRAEFFGPAFL
ncbi:MAG: FAD:protein FMN transferase [Actinobacteria bacterium]|jgi:thiamine biosynthesis lipoprotein|nr:FAD:protein FMN transferase [Actinomycetota bacterium]